MSARALTLYDTDSDSDDSSMAGDSKPMASMSIANDPCGKEDRWELDSDLETTYSDSSEDYITSEQAQKYNPANLRVEARRTLDYDSESDDDGDANRGYSAQTVGGFNRSVMANGLKDDETSIGSDDDYDPIIRERTDLPKAFVSNDAELDALIPVGHAKDKIVTTTTINPEGHTEVIRYREGDKEHAKVVVKGVSSTKKSAQESAVIVAKALAKARAEKGKHLTKEETKDIKEYAIHRAGTIKKLTKQGVAKEMKGIARDVATEKTAKNVKGQALTELKELSAKVEDDANREEEEKHMKDYIKKTNPSPKTILRKGIGARAMFTALEKIADKVDKKQKTEAFVKLKDEAKARSLVKIAEQKAKQYKSADKIKEFFKSAISKIKEKASAELEEAISKQERRAIADLLTSKGYSSSEDDGKDQTTVTAGGQTKGTRSEQLSRANAEVKELMSRQPPIEIEGKNLTVDVTAGGKRQLKYDGKSITSNKVNLPVLLKIQEELGKTRRTDPLANALREIVDDRIYTARSQRGKGKVGGQGKRSVSPKNSTEELVTALNNVAIK